LRRLHETLCRRHGNAERRSLPAAPGERPMSEVTRAIALVALLALTACGYPPVVLPQTSAPVHFTVHEK